MYMDSFEYVNYYRPCTIILTSNKNIAEKGVLWLSVIDQKEENVLFRTGAKVAGIAPLSKRHF